MSNVVTLVSNGQRQWWKRTNNSTHNINTIYDDVGVVLCTKKPGVPFSSANFGFSSANSSKIKTSKQFPLLHMLQTIRFVWCIYKLCCYSFINDRWYFVRERTSSSNFSVESRLCQLDSFFFFFGAWFFLSLFVLCFSNTLVLWDRFLADEMVQVFH